MAVMKDDGYRTHDNPFARLIEAGTNCLHDHIKENGSPKEQNLDTHINAPYKAGMRTKYIEYQQTKLAEHLEDFGGDLTDLALRVAAGENPYDMPSWQPPVEIKLPVPSRAQVILWGREVRKSLFDSESGRKLIRQSMEDCGMVRDQNGKDWTYSELMARRKKEADDRLKTNEGKKEKAQAKLKSKYEDFQSVVSRFMKVTVNEEEECEIF